MDGYLNKEEDNFWPNKLMCMISSLSRYILRHHMKFVNNVGTRPIVCAARIPGERNGGKPS